jgi:hypothetical protein
VGPKRTGGEQLLMSNYGWRITFEVEDLHPKSSVDNYRLCRQINVEKLLMKNKYSCTIKNYYW